ncbi:hypothetical protein S1OALGB6SA_434 [Olavius algarvensis spirochete endosymbiont]|uniref:NYN domain-containing protein n=1 Tax=Olavius algarvensis spirochete endosymbiont TaxID=260710 RepID=UPI000F1B7BBA|nr:NYN domain-containing protein [Olavius algarvensis spirochete endosymbiont]CAD7843532.1 MAG: hypothetical protein [Olavius algarvensis spirochete endosymbiont]VDA99366.1 hypothetical protein S1OALGB6SA_434 [Olavius algarvensis spirochete endosymbiont]
MSYNVAIFWDVENVKPSSSANLFIQGLWDYSEGLGRVVSSYAYADWSMLAYKQLGPSLASLHFNMIHVPFRGRRRDKNSADMHLTNDCLDLLRFQSHIDVFLLLTGDSDFRPLVMNLKKAGKITHIVCDIKNASNDLLRLADSFTDYRDMFPSEEEDSFEDTTDENTGKRAITTAYSKEYWFERLAETASILHKEKKGTDPGNVKISMKKLNQGFDEKSLGYKRWGDFIASASRAGYINMEYDDKQSAIIPGRQFSQETGSLQIALKTLVETLTEMDGRARQPEFHRYAVVSSKLRDKGINTKTLGFSQFKKFISSAEARGLVETQVEKLASFVKRL